MRVSRFRVAVALLLSTSAAVQAAAPATDADIMDMIKTRVDVDHAGTGIVVGIVDAQGSRVLTYGTVSAVGRPSMPIPSTR